MLKKLIKFVIAWFKIPKGPYCYAIKRVEKDPTGEKPPILYTTVCPYWVRINDLPDQENGYCNYLGYGDNYMNNDPNRKFVCTVKETGKKNIVAAPDMPFGIGLLWDKCKECGIKDPDAYYE